MRCILTTLLTFAMIAGGLAGLCTTPAAARIYSVQPTNEDGAPPTDQFTTADPIFAIFKSDVEGGEICVVPEGNPEDKSHCKIIANFVGTGWWLIAPHLPVLRAGRRYQLLAHDPNYSFLSVPFLVTDCVGPDCAERRRMSNEVVEGWKHAAEEQLERLHVVETSIKIGEIGDAFFEARHHGLDLIEDPIDHHLTGWVATAAFAGAVGGIAFTTIELSKINVPTSWQGAFLILAREVTKGTQAMYEDIVKDPPDFNYTTVAAPAFTEWPSTGDALHDRVVRTFERQRAFGRAQLKAYERYLGAAADGQEVYVRMQAQAVADYGEALAAEMKESAAALRAWGAQLDPNLPTITQEHLDETMAVYERVRASGFTQDELDQLTAAGLGAAEIAQVRAAFDDDISQTPVGVPMRDTLTRAADALEAAAPSVLTFSNEAAWVAGGRAPKTVSITPASASLQTGSTHNVSATVTDARNEPIAGVSIALSVTGANPTALTATTDAGGVAAFSYTGANPGDDTLSATAGTAVSGTASVRWTVGSPNAVPSVLGYGNLVEEGELGAFEFHFTDADTQDSHTAVIDWGDGSAADTYPRTDGQPGYIWEYNGSGYVRGYHRFAESGDYQVAGTVTDNRGGAGTAVLAVNVKNVAPALNSITLEEEAGGEIVFSAAFTDRGVRDTHTAQINWGDGTSGPAAVTEADGSGSAGGRHAYGAPGIYNLTLTVTDDDGGTASRTTGLTIGSGGLSNSPPVLLLSNYITFEGGGSFSAEFIDPDSLDVHTGTIDWGDGSPVQPLLVQERGGSGMIFANHSYADDGQFTITVTIADNHGGVASGVAPMNVQNYAPVVFGVGLTTNKRLFTTGDTINVSSSFLDYGVRDTHTAVWDWGDGTTKPAAFTPTGGYTPVSDSHTYTTPGVYLIRLLVTDDDSATGVSPTFETIGVYPSVTEGSIKPVVTETGKISVSVSGLGTTAQDGVLRVKKPAGATVRRAFMGAATRGFFRYLLSPGEVKLENVAVPWEIATPSGIQSYNFWGEVTDIVKAKLDAAPAGEIELSLREERTHETEGEVLVVVFDDPGQTRDNTVALLFGAQQTSGDTFALRFAEPLDLSDPDSALTMSLGVSFGHQDQSGQQYSVIDVNGRRMTTSAGGEDDGEVANGALLTVGGFGDSPDTPTDPYALPRQPRADDELYDLRPFVNAGDTELTVATSNPSNDDNIFFAAFFLKNAAAVVGEGIVLTPVSATPEVGTSHTLTAAAQDARGQLLQGREVTFEVISGPHAGLSGTATTDAQGLARFTYDGGCAGTDTVIASFINSDGRRQTSNTVTAEWSGAAVVPTLLSISPASGTYGGMTELSTRLTANGSPLGGRDVTFSLNGIAVGVARTDAAGVATVPNVSLAGVNAGTYQNAVAARFAGDMGHAASDGTATLTVGKATSRVVTDGKLFANGGPGVLTASLLDSNSPPVANRALTLTLGEGAGAQACTATTDAAGRASCRIERVAQPLGPGTVVGSFAGDANYLPSADIAATLVYVYPKGGVGGSFIIGDLNAAVGQQVTFWGAQWSKANALSGGTAPSSFKGFANQSGTGPATCGGTWATGPGNSPGPPSSLPSYMAVIVSSSITKTGSMISGNVSRIVIVKTGPGYDSDPGHAGTGTVVAVWCP